MSQCCAEGFVHSGTPVGKVIKIGNIPCYYSPASVPSSSSSTASTSTTTSSSSTASTSTTTSSSSPSYSTKAIIICTDVFGYELVNVRLVADSYAALGTFDVYVPDLHNGDSLHALTYDPIFLPPPGFFNSVKSGFKFAASLPSLISWFSKHNEKVTNPILDSFIYDLRTERPSLTKFGAIGYCWGGKFSVLLGGKVARERSRVLKLNDKEVNVTPTVDCVIACHPSALTVPTDIENLSVPAFFALAETDGVFSKKDVEATKKVLRTLGTLRENTHNTKNDGSASSSASGGLEFIVNEYKGTKHGFAVRGSENDPVVVENRNKVLKESHEFLVKYLA